MLTDAQKQQRKTGIGATDCAAVMGVSPYKTPYELWMVKTGRMEEEAILSDDRLRLRHAHEETIANEYAFQKQVQLRRVNQTSIHKQRPYMLCNLDRVITGQRKIVECKSSSGFMRHLWGANGTDEAPIHYILQVQHQLSVTEYDDADLAALIDIDDYRIFPMPRNEKVISRLEAACEYFWEHHVLKDIPPAPTTRGDLKLMYPTNNGNFIEMTADIDAAITILGNKKENIKQYTFEKEEIEKTIIEFIADHDGIVHDNQIIATFKADKRGTRSLRIKERL